MATLVTLFARESGGARRRGAASWRRGAASWRRRGNGRNRDSRNKPQACRPILGAIPAAGTAIRELDCWATPDATLNKISDLHTGRYHCLSSQTDVDDIFYNDKYNDNDNDDDDDDDDDDNNNNNNKYFHCVVLLLKVTIKCHVVWKLSRLSC